MVNLVLQVFFAITIWCSVSVGILRFTLSSPLIDPTQAVGLVNALLPDGSRLLPVFSSEEWLLLGFFTLAMVGAFVITAMLMWLAQRLQHGIGGAEVHAKHL